MLGIVGMVSSRYFVLGHLGPEGVKESLGWRRVQITAMRAS